jgi:AcrR family transcriptional regulator
MAARTDRGPLSRERVLSAALAIADTEGLEAVTMRRVAGALDREAMTLYYYVRDKRALLAAMAEAVVGEIVEASLHGAPAAGAADWRGVVRARCLAARRVMLSHPWAPALVAAQPQAPPPAFALFEALVAALVEAGASYELAHRAIHALGSMVLGFTQELFDPGPDVAPPSPEELVEMARVMPHLARIAQVAEHEAEGSLSTCDTQAEFEFTMDLILDGLEAHRAASRPGAGRRGR